MNTNQNETIDLSLQGTAIQPTKATTTTAANSSSRPTSARRHSQSKQSTTPSREGSAKEHQTDMNTNVHLSSARQRRLSNSSQRSFGLRSPPPPPQPVDTNKSIPVSTTSSVFRVLSPRQHEVDRFFTDQSEQKSDDSEPEETRRWVDELHQLNAPILPQEQQQQFRNVGYLGMSRDSLNGTVPSTNFHDEILLPTKALVNMDPKSEEASIKIQRWYRKNNTKVKQNHSQQEYESNNRVHHSRPPSVVTDSIAKEPTTFVRSPREIQLQENNDNQIPSRPDSRRSSRASSAAKELLTRVRSPTQQQKDSVNNNCRPGSRQPSFTYPTPKSLRSPRVDESIPQTQQQDQTNNSRPGSRRSSFTSITPKRSRSPERSPRINNSISQSQQHQENVNTSSKPSSLRPSFTNVTSPRVGVSMTDSQQLENDNNQKSISRRSSTSSSTSKPILSPREILKQASGNNSRASSRRSSTASSTSKPPRTPVPSPLPPTVKNDEKPTTAASSVSSTSTLTSKVTLDEVYETLKKLEEIEQFPTQPSLVDDAAYLIDPPQLSTEDEINPYDSIVESVRSQKLPKREILSPNLPRFTPPPPSSSQTSSRRQQQQQQPIKVTQSAFVPFTRTTGSYDQQIPTREKDPTDRYSIHFEGDFDYQLQKQKVEYEATIQRHLKFIDQLIDDKKKLTSRCELLVSELRTIDRKCNDRIRLIEDAHRDEIQKLKDVHESAERIRREQWIEEKTKKIKELTVRGLEPEIQKLISKHKNEIAKIRAVHEAELLASDERASQRYIRMVEELRDQLEREKEVAIAHERELARDKYEKALRDEEKSYNEQRRRLYAEIEEEKSRQAELISKQRADLDKLRRDIEENHRSVVETTKREYEGIRLEQERRHTNEINDLKEKLNLEKENWEETYMRKQETILAARERQLREQMKQERDKEIERIITQLESDTTVTKEEAERTAENRVKRIRDKYESEFLELENSEKQTKERLNQTRAQLTEIEGENERLQIILKQKETEIEDIKKITDTLQKERERLSDIIRQEFADRLVATDDENRRIKNEIAELRARQQLELEKKKEELEALRKQQEKELETIHEKIKQAITKKDEQVQTLRVQYDTVVKRAEHLENLLSQQRKLVSARSTSASKKTQPS